MIILNSYEEAVDMFDKKSSIYSDRPRMVTVENIGLHMAASLIRSGETHREYRRLMNKALGTREITHNFHGLIENETRKFIYRVLGDPGHLNKHIRR